MTLSNMNEEQVRKVFREELAHFMSQSKFTFQRPIQILDGNDITLGQTVGTRVGSTGSKLGFFGQTPRAKYGAGFLIQPTGGGGSSGDAIDNAARARIQDINTLLGDTSGGFGFATFP